MITQEQALAMLGLINEGMTFEEVNALNEPNEEIYYFTPKMNTHESGKTFRWKSAPNQKPIWQRLTETRDTRKDRFDYREFTRAYLADATEQLAHRYGFHRGLYPA